MFALVLLCVWPIFSVLGTCPGGFCPRTLIYDDLGCKAVFASETDCCPTHYDCSHIDKAAEIKDKCHFQGKQYSVGEQLNDDDIYGNCHVNCFCRNDNGNLGFTCAALDCPEFLGHHAPPGCHLKYDVGKCCSVGTACPPFNHTCDAGGKTYNIGERFDHPYQRCSTCACKEGFTFGDCRKNTCTAEIRHRKDIENYCAPSYRESDECCPWSWICPEENDSIDASKTPTAPSALKCKFGKRELNIGESFKTDDKKYGGTVACECRVPPLMTCIHTFAPSPPIEKLKLIKIQN